MVVKLCRAAFVLCLALDFNRWSLAFTTSFPSNVVTSFLRENTAPSTHSFLAPAKVPAFVSHIPQFRPFLDNRRVGLSEKNHFWVTMNKALARPTSIQGNAGGDGKRVAIIGGGISGLVCGNRLQELGFEPFVFDTGRKAVGGRASSRVLSVPAEEPVADVAKDSAKPNSKQSKPRMMQYKVDHSSQFFTAEDAR